MISIIIPVYNVDKYLSKCVESILSQSFKDFELILINDGSTDNSAQVCDYYASIDNRITVIHKVNEGVSSARNTGMQIAKGEWVTFIDADDYVSKNLLQDYVCNMDGCDMLIQGFSHNAEKDIVLEDRVITGKDVIYKFLNIKSEICRFVWNKIYKTDIIRNNHIEFNVDMTMIEDLLFNLYYLKHCKTVKIINKVNYLYIRHEGAACFRQHKFLSLKNTVKEFNSFYNEIFDGDPDTVFKSKSVIHCYALDVLRLSFKEKIRSREIKLFIQYIKDQNKNNPYIGVYTTNSRNKIITWLIRKLPVNAAYMVLGVANRLFGK